MIDHPNHVWATDITYIPMARGFVYLAAVMDWFARRILAWRLSNAMEASFCIDAVEEALAKHGCPQIFNADQGSVRGSLSARLWRRRRSTAIDRSLHRLLQRKATSRRS
jgi:transposase InsO family protein